jgi:predicted esterase
MQAHPLSTPRTARYYTLGGSAGPVAEVWVALHGYGQQAARFLRPFEAVAGPDRLVVAPEALSRFYTDGAHQHVGASWMTREDREAEIADYVAFLDGAFADACRRTGADPHAVRLVALGFSQGAATAARWLALSPLLAGQQPRAARLVLWGADLPHDLDLPAAHPWLSAVDLTLVVGDADAYATPERVAAMEARLREADVPYRLVGFPGGHRIVPAVLKALADG